MKQIIPTDVLEKISKLEMVEYVDIGIRLSKKCLIHGYGFEILCSRYELIEYMNELADEIQNIAKKGTYFYVE